jgi:phytoene/squalene synthetase
VADAARAVNKARDLYEDVERARYLLPDRTQRQVDAGREDERLQPCESVAGSVGVLDLPGA